MLGYKKIHYSYISNRFQNALPFRIQNLLGFRTGVLLRVNADTHRVLTKPRVNFKSYGASH